MFARILEFVPKMDKKEEMIRMVKNEILPILKKQTGFVDILPFVPESNTDKVITISLWNNRRDFERYEKQWLNKVEEMLRPYLVTEMMHRFYNLETTLCEHFEKTLVA